MKNYSYLFIILLSSFLNAQVGIGTKDGPNDAAMLEVKSTNQGILIPQITLTGTTDTATIPNPETSLLIFNTATVSDVYPGYYFWNGTKWDRFITGFQESVKCSNTNITSNINTSSFSNAPIFGATEWNDNPAIYTVDSSNNAITVRIGGTYQIEASLYYNIAKSGYSIAGQVAVNGVNKGSLASTGYIDGKSSDNENASITLIEVLELNANDVINIKVRRDSDKSDPVNLTSVGTSNITITKIK
ncbi:hypothetical protein KORDIASMS9_04364 [Kordia sp. SMS9]|uniref:hypothetical protein n=1 Tax=Kordia sp. SMS9 TaxID=2282170 RepID=UPI000E0DD881|nr:hypothetical protein [Kordia sp. SMS9]AXG72101.1 hypothetical protein KORDIASMS9_04364 [Kordia sp. SMS9]